MGLNAPHPIFGDRRSECHGVIRRRSQLKLVVSPIELCLRQPTAQVLAVDLAENMLDVARTNVAAAGLTDRIKIQRVDAKELPFDEGRFAAVISNSIVHHIPKPQSVLAETVRVVHDGALILFRDLMRPSDDATLEHLVDTYALGANSHQQQMFRDSLHAALAIEEIRDLVAGLGFSPDSVQPTSDRHWTWSVRK